MVIFFYDSDKMNNVILENMHFRSLKSPSKRSILPKLYIVVFEKSYWSVYSLYKK